VREARGSTGFQVLEHDLGVFQPGAIGIGEREGALDFGVRDDAVFDEIDQQHLARLQAPLGDNLFPREPAARPFRKPSRQDRRR